MLSRTDSVLFVESILLSDTESFNITGSGSLYHLDTIEAARGVFESSLGVLKRFSNQFLVLISKRPVLVPALTQSGFWQYLQNSLLNSSIGMVVLAFALVSARHSFK